MILRVLVCVLCMLFSRLDLLGYRSLVCGCVSWVENLKI